MTKRQWIKKLERQVKIEEVTLDFFNVQVFEAPDIFKLTKDDIGKRVWLSGEYKTLNAVLKDIIKDGPVVTIKGRQRKVKGSYSQERVFYPEEVILHPDEIDSKRLKNYGYKVKDSRKV